MQKIYLASAALLGLAAGGAFAQAPPAAASPGTPPSGTPASMTARGGIWRVGTEPYSANASNITPADTRSIIAPRLPTPAVGENATPEQFLRAADQALRAHHTGLAQEALERAETLLLDRATAPSAAGQPDDAPRIAMITQARQALGTGDLATAQRLVTQALAAGGT